MMTFYTDFNHYIVFATEVLFLRKDLTLTFLSSSVKPSQSYVFSLLLASFFKD